MLKAPLMDAFGYLFAKTEVCVCVRERHRVREREREREIEIEIKCCTRFQWKLRESYGRPCAFGPGWLTGLTSHTPVVEGMEASPSEKLALTSSGPEQGKDSGSAIKLPQLRSWLPLFLAPLC